MKNNSDEKHISPKQQKKDEEKHKKTKKKNLWPLYALLITLVLSFAFSLLSELVLGNANLVVAYLLVIIIIFISIFFDMIGTAATACDIEPFLSMSARKVKGAKMAVKLVKNAEKVSSICADIIGDICGIVSGACGGMIVLMQFVNNESIFVSVLFSAVIAALMVSGKALGKTYAISKSNKIVFFVAKALSVFKKD